MDYGKAGGRASGAVGMTDVGRWLELHHAPHLGSTKQYLEVQTVDFELD